MAAGFGYRQGEDPVPMYDRGRPCYELMPCGGTDAPSQSLGRAVPLSDCLWVAAFTPASYAFLTSTPPDRRANRRFSCHTTPLTVAAGDQPDDRIASVLREPLVGIEPTTPCLQDRCSAELSFKRRGTAGVASRNGWV